MHIKIYSQGLFSNSIFIFFLFFLYNYYIIILFLKEFEKMNKSNKYPSLFLDLLFIQYN